MPDFIYSNNADYADRLAQSLLDAYPPHDTKIHRLVGEWGALIMRENHYHGFSPLETDTHLVGILGGPVLQFRDNSFLTHSPSSDGTRSLYERWIAGNLVWRDDLSGPFCAVIIDKRTQDVRFITDLMSFIPLFEHRFKDSITVGSHVDMVAAATNEHKNIDRVSAADFILHDIITFPYTLYSSISQLSPGSETTYRSGHKKKVTSYWHPSEVYPYSFEESTERLRNGLQNYISQFTKSMSRTAQFVSGGEDSRVLCDLMPKHLKRDGYIFLDQMNREGNTAKKVADCYGINFTPIYRHSTYYADILEFATDLVGSGVQYAHAHSAGLYLRCDLPDYSAVVGGYLADSLLKGMFSYKMPATNRFPFLPEIALEGESRTKKIESPLIPKKLTQEVTARRRSRFQQVKEIRPHSAHEWFTLWPASMEAGIPNFWSTRRLFRSYEPFLCHDLVKLSARTPINWKLNRKLFHNSVKPYLRKSKSVLHANGYNPYYSKLRNLPLHFSTWLFRLTSKRLGVTKDNQGPWGNKTTLRKSRAWKEKETMYLRSLKQVTEILEEVDDHQLAPLHNKTVRNLVQLGYQLTNRP